MKQMSLKIAVSEENKNGEGKCRVGWGWENNLISENNRSSFFFCPPSTKIKVFGPLCSLLQKGHSEKSTHL